MEEQAVHKAINKLKKEKEKLQQEQEFTSHEFIQKYIECAEDDYFNMLCQYGKKGRFRYVHQKIGRYLLKHSAKLGIEKADYMKGSLTIKGNKNKIHVWKIK